MNSKQDSANDRGAQGTDQGGNDEGQRSSGQGAASALARMKSQHEHRSQQTPAEDASQGRKQ